MRASFVVTTLALLAAASGSALAAPLPRSQRAELLAHVPAVRVQADTDGNRLFDNLEAQLGGARADGSIPVIVRYRAGQTAAVAAVRRGDRALRLDGSVARRLTREEISRLAASGAVESIEADGVCEATRESSQESVGATKSRADFGLTGDADGDPTRYSAEDLTIAVIDSGIDGSHPDFAGGKIIGWKDFVNGRPEPYDDDGHGTHVASIAAGAVVNGVGGVAPGASLVAVKVMDEEGRGFDSRTAQGVEWCIENRERYGIDVINMSLSNPNAANGTDLVSRLVNQAVAAGIVVCCSAGNRGPDPYTIGSPSAAAGAITVGNMIDTGKGGFALVASSGRGPTADGRVKPDLCGPGYQILAAEANTGDYVEYSGTSMAAPFVAGVAALMRQANPKLSPEQVKAIMKGTAVHFGRAGENNEYGAGRLDGYAAIARAAGREGVRPATPDHLFGAGHLSGNGERHVWDLPIDDTRYPVAVTLITEGAGVDFDLAIYDPQGRLVASGEDEGRQEVASLKPKLTGTYTVVVSNIFFWGGDYTIDISAGSSLK